MTRFGPGTALAQPRADAFRVTVDDTMDVREGRWDGQRSRTELRRYAETDDGVDWRRASRGYTVFDLDPEGDRDPVQADGKLPVAYVEDGELVGIGNGIRNALARLDQTRGLAESVRRDARATLESMLARLNKQTADAVVNSLVRDGQALTIDAGAAASSIAKAMDQSRRRLADVERSAEEQAEIRDKFPRLVNMTPGEMRAWMDNPFSGPSRKSGDARASAREALNDVIRLKEKRMSEWTEGDYDDAVEAIAFIERMSEVDQGEPLVVEGREGPSARDASLKDWGHDLGKADRYMATDGAVWRWSRLDIELDSDQRSLLDRAIAVADRLEARGDSAELKTIAAELRADGLEDHNRDGFLVLPVLAARTGTQVYSDGVTSWGEFRSVDEVGDATSLASYGLKPFTDDHPPVMVTPDNYTAYAKGACGQDAVLVEQPGPDGNRYVKVTILVGDAATLRKIRDGKVELSAGYTTVTVRDSGTDAAGKNYDYRQTKIRINHLALVDRGRAGPLARIRPDGAAWELPASNADTQEHEVNDTKDQLDPAMARMMLMAVVVYMMPPSPEAGAEALGQLVEMTGLPESEVQSLLAHEKPEEMELVEMDGITARMTPDDAKAWRERESAAAKLNADAAQKNKDALELLAETKAALATTQRQVDSLVADQKRAAIDALYSEIRSVCPQLVEAWDKLKKDGKFTLSATDMRERATLDLDPGAAKDFARAREDKTFEATLLGSYKSAVRGALARKANDNDNGNGEPNGETNNDGADNVVSALDRLNQRAAGFYGSK